MSKALKPKDMPLLSELPTEDWNEKFDKIMEDDYTSKKYNRQKRLSMKIKYVNEMLPELKEGGQSVLDLGPGPGEFLEVCRFYGNKVKGIDAKAGDSEMGDEYLDLSMLLAQRQNLGIHYIGADESIDAWGRFFYDDGAFDVINSQGAIEQICKDYMVGERHRVHKTASKLSWAEKPKTVKFLTKFFTELHRLTKTGGTILIYANGAKNVKYYDKTLRKICKDLGLEIVHSKGNVLHKMRKT